MKKRVGILTFFKSINNGAFLQAYSLWSFLSERYADWAVVEMINYDSKLAMEHYVGNDENQKNIDNRNKFRECLKLFTLSEGSLISDDISEIEKYIMGLNYDLIIVGSDEVWKTDGMRGFPNAYWLNYDVGNAKRVAYAVSGRNDYQQLNDEQKSYLRESLEKFIYIGIRDRITQNELRKLCKKEMFGNCDPTFLLAEKFKIDSSEIREKRKTRKLNTDKKTVLVILYDWELMKQLYRMLGGEYNIIATFDICGNATDWDYYAQTPFEWQELIAVSDMVITSLFHGTVFSLIHNRKFLSIETTNCGRGKVEDLLVRNGLEKHLVHAEKFNVRGKTALGREIFTRVRRMMREEDNVSYDFIIEAEVKRSKSFFEEMDSLFGIMNGNES